MRETNEHETTQAVDRTREHERRRSRWREREASRRREIVLREELEELRLSSRRQESSPEGSQGFRFRAETPGGVNVALNAGMFTSSTDDWATPRDFFEKLDAEFHFDLDVCASETNAKCERFFTKADDGLSQEWRGRCWMNPPYGREIGQWVRKAFETSLRGGACRLSSFIF